MGGGLVGAAEGLGPEDDEAGAFFVAGVDRDVAAVLFDDLLDGPEAEAVAGVALGGAAELEEMRQVAGQDAGAVIGYGEFYAAAGVDQGEGDAGSEGGLPRRRCERG